MAKEVLLEINEYKRIRHSSSIVKPPSKLSWKGNERKIVYQEYQIFNKKTAAQ